MLNKREGVTKQPFLCTKANKKNINQSAVEA